jgi:hypothetical protein
MENDYGHDLDLLIVSHQSHLSNPTRSGCMALEKKASTQDHITLWLSKEREQCPGRFLSISG